MKHVFSLSQAALVALSITLAGCADESTSSTDTAPPLSERPPDTVEVVHDHPSEGPHHGALIELGAEEYHAELLHDEDAGTVTIYILDGAAKATVSIAAAEITINMKHDGNAEQFTLAASADAGDPEGQSSRFVSDDEHLGEDLHAEGAEATLVLSIDGKSFRGDIQHDHDHAGHGHEH